MDLEPARVWIVFLLSILLLSVGLAIVYFGIRMLRTKRKRIIQRNRRPEAEKKRLQQKERQKHEEITED